MAHLLELHVASLLPEVLALPEVSGGPLLVLGSGSNVLIADENGTVRKMTPDGTVTTLAGSPGQTGIAEIGRASGRERG